jgi:polyphosphate kinase 2
LHRTVREQGRRVAIVFEGRDTAGKSSAIRRFVANLNPRSARVVALPKPTDVEKGQWFFQRYVAHLPNPGEIVFFDRSWYNRAVVEPVNGFCTEEQYRIFMEQVPEFEHMLHEDNMELLKLWFAVSPEVQAERFASRRSDPLKQWKLSPLDEKAQDLWDSYTHYIDAMFHVTHTSFCPWVVIDADNQRRARLEAIRHVLWQLDYEGKGASVRTPDPDIVALYDPSGAHRG